MIAVPLQSTRALLRWLTPNESRHAQARADRSFLISLLLFAASLRIAAASGSLWLDEIWSLEVASLAPSPAAILTDFPTDNNHFLNTLYLKAVGTGRPSLVYRLPAILGGTLTVWLGYQIARHWGRIAAMYVSTCLASSYLLIHYSSEARGYSFALAAGCLAALALMRVTNQRGWSWTIVFWSSCILGALSHPVFTHFLLATACWSITVFSRQSTRCWEGILSLGQLFSIPFLVTAVLMVSHWSRMELGGGPAYSLVEVLAQTASLALGGPLQGAVAKGVAFLAIAVVGLACWTLRRERFHSGLLLLLLSVIPVVLAIAVQPPFLFPRYFLVSVLCFPIGAGVVLARIHRGGFRGQAVAALLLVVFVAANLAWTVRLVTVGRGQYTQALQFMLDNSDAAEVVISSDHNFGIRKLIDFYSSGVTSTRRIHYCNGDRWPATGADWLILHRTFEDVRPAPNPLLMVDGHRFQLEGTFDCSPLSGWQWWCYRRVDGDAKRAVRSAEKL